MTEKETLSERLIRLDTKFDSMFSVISEIKITVFRYSQDILSLKQDVHALKLEHSEIKKTLYKVEEDTKSNTTFRIKRDGGLVAGAGLAVAIIVELVRRLML